MTKKEKAKAMNKISYIVNKAKSAMQDASDAMLDEGLEKDSYMVYKMILRLEEIQTKYDDYRL